MSDPIPAFVVFFGALVVIACWLAGRQQTMVPTPGMTDYWTTPLYLRSNTPVFDGSAAIVPSYPSDPWSLAVYSTEL